MSCPSDPPSPYGVMGNVFLAATDPKAGHCQHYVFPNVVFQEKKKHFAFVSVLSLRKKHGLSTRNLGPFASPTKTRKRLPNCLKFARNTQRNGSLYYQFCQCRCVCWYLSKFLFTTGDILRRQQVKKVLLALLNDTGLVNKI